MQNPYLEVRRGTDAEKVPLGDQPFSVGRDPANAISFPAERTISRYHAIVERLADGWCVRDLGSSNGTYINGVKLTSERLLQPGDEIRLGDCRIIFRMEPAGSVNDRTASHEALPPGSTTYASEVSPPEGPASYLDVSDEWSGDFSPSAERDYDPQVPGRQPDARVKPPERSLASGSSLANPPSPTEAVESPVTHTQRVVSRHDGGRGRVRGVARSVQTLPDTGAIHAFRVDVYDSHGDRGTPVPVEVREYRAGQISEGEEVEVSGTWSHGTLRADDVVNLSTGAEVRVWRIFGVTAGTFAALCFVVLAVLGGALLLFTHSRSEARKRANSIVVVPDVVGKVNTLARDDIESAGLRPLEINETSRSVPTFHVIRTEPPAGVALHRGSRVTIVFSFGS